jgi:hypothetical protein
MKMDRSFPPVNTSPSDALACPVGRHSPRRHRVDEGLVGRLAKGAMAERAARGVGSERRRRHVRPHLHEAFGPG